MEVDPTTTTTETEPIRKKIKPTIRKNTKSKSPETKQLKALLAAMNAARRGDFSVRLPVRSNGIMGEIFQAFNGYVALNEARTKEILRVSKIIGQEGRLTERMHQQNLKGAWKLTIDSINSLINN